MKLLSSAIVVDVTKRKIDKVAKKKKKYDSFFLRIAPLYLKRSKLIEQNAGIYQRQDLRNIKSFTCKSVWKEVKAFKSAPFQVWLVSLLSFFILLLPVGNTSKSLTSQLLACFSRQTFSQSFLFSLSLCCVFLPHSLPHRVARAIGQRRWKVGQWEGSCQAVCAAFGGCWKLSTAVPLKSSRT